MSPPETWPRRAVVFCAGEGTRLRPLTLDRPKPMLEIGGRPILAYILTWLREQGIGEVAINLYYRPEAIVEQIGDGAALGLRVTYSREPSLLGSAGALRPLGAYLAGAPFVAVYGDTLATLALAPLFELHARVRPAATMALVDHPRPTEAGIVQLDDREPWHGGLAGRVARLVEKPAPDRVFSRIANAGIVVIEPSAIGCVPAGRPSDLAADLIPALLAAGETVAGWRVPAEAVVRDVGTWPSFRWAQRAWPRIWAARSRPICLGPSARPGDGPADGREGSQPARR